MGILNVTPDSFSDGGHFLNPAPAVARVRQMISEGADMIDVGGESSGPGSADVSEEEELRRVGPVIDLIRSEGLTGRVLFSIDTYKADVARYALEHGFGMVNDVTALRGDSKMIEALLEFRPYVILMYSKDSTARTTRELVSYDDVVKTVGDFLKARAEVLLRAGFPREKIIVDPGMGAFVSGDPQYSFELIDRLGELAKLGYPILVGVSRKGFLGGRVGDRDEASVNLSLKALQNGATIVRVHDVGRMSRLL